ncbi:MAG: MmgE/PrpD family protein [Deltaproteobacteria bacterium]|nr:MmgE/PrpD family protein [Deltaproteobacteria bacterium]
MAYTEQVVEFVVQTRFEEIPAKAIDVAKQAVIDSVGVCLAGSREDPAKISGELAQEEIQNGDATVFGQGFKTSASMAALVNGTAGHALDYDHSFVLMGQPTAGLAPAVFALCEAIGASGRDFLEAYVVGFELTAKLAWSMPGHSSKGGWHATGTLGSLGATAACSRLLGLPPDRVRMALGIATSMASGVVWNFGTMTKPLHAGLAARNGVLAAKLAAKSFSGNSSILEVTNGFHESFSGSFPHNLAPLSSLGSSYELVERGIKFKAYPCGGLTHSAIDAVLAMRNEHGLAQQMVDQIKVKVTLYTHSRIVYRIPETGLQGKFSMAYIVARALIDGRVTLDSFTDEAVRDPAVLSLAERVHMELDPDLEENEDGSRPCSVEIRLKDGRILSRQVDYPKGTRNSPMSTDELRQKFVDCASRLLTENSLNRVAGMLDELESQKSLAPLCQLLQGNN